MASQRLLAINAVFPPARGATGDLLEELSCFLAEREWTVEVVTGPAEGEPRVSHRRAITVYRTSGRALEDASAIGRRAWHVAASTLRLWALARRCAQAQPDVVLTMTDPPLGFLAGPMLGRIAGAPVVHWSQDAYPDIAVALGVLEDGRLASWLRRGAGRALAGHDAVVAIGRDMADHLRPHTATADLEVVPNWPLDGVAPDPRARLFRAEHGLEDVFVAMHAGAVGLAHPFEAILEAAERMQTWDRPGVVLFVGDGTRRPALEAEVRRRRIETVRFLPFLPREDLAGMLSAADVHLVSMAPGLEGLLVPSKAYGAMGVGRPVVFLGPPLSEAARVVLEADAGRVIPHDGAVLASVLEGYRNQPHEARAAGERGRHVVEGARSRSLHALTDLLTRLADRPISEGR